MKKLIIILVLFVSCSPKLITSIQLDVIEIEKINVNYLKNISSVDLKQNDTIILGKGEFKNDFWLINKSSDGQSTIYVNKSDNKIIEIDKHQYIYKEGLEIRSEFYSNGNLKKKYKTIKKEPITNNYFKKISFSPFLIEFISLDNNGNIENYFVFDRDYKYKLSDFISGLTKINELEGKQISIQTIYVSEDDIFGGIGLDTEKKLKKNYPYWGAFWHIENSSNFYTWIYDGKSGEFVEKKLVKIITAID